MFKNTYGFKLKTEKEYLKDINIDPDNIHLRLRLADLYVRKKKKKKALEQYKIAAEKLQLAGKSNSVFAIFRTMLKIDPNNEDAKSALFAKDKTAKKSITKFKESNLKDFVKNIELFKDLSSKELEEICNNLNIKKFIYGDQIIKQGEEGDSIYLILEGNVKVHIDDEIGKEIDIAYLTKGDFFGEMGFFGNKVRRANVTAIDEVTLLELKKENVDRLIEKHKNIEEAFLKFYNERILDLIVATSPIFHLVDNKVRKELVSKFKLKKFKAGSIIIKEGDATDTMYLIKSGVVKVLKDGHEITRLNPGSFFGEIGLITGQQRTADILAETDVELMELTKEDIDFIVSKYPEVLTILNDYVKQRTSDTFSKLIELKKMSSKKGIV